MTDRVGETLKFGPRFIERGSCSVPQKGFGWVFVNYIDSLERLVDSGTTEDFLRMDPEEMESDLRKISSDPKQAIQDLKSVNYAVDMAIHYDYGLDQEVSVPKTALGKRLKRVNHAIFNEHLSPDLSLLEMRSNTFFSNAIFSKKNWKRHDNLLFGEISPWTIHNQIERNDNYVGHFPKLDGEVRYDRIISGTSLNKLICTPDKMDTFLMFVAKHTSTHGSFHGVIDAFGMRSFMFGGPGSLKDVVVICFLEPTEEYPWGRVRISVDGVIFEDPIIDLVTFYEKARVFGFHVSVENGKTLMSRLRRQKKTKTGMSEDIHPDTVGLMCLNLYRHVEDAIRDLSFPTPLTFKKLNLVSQSGYDSSFFGPNFPSSKGLPFTWNDVPFFNPLNTLVSFKRNGYEGKIIMTNDKLRIYVEEKTKYHEFQLKYSGPSLHVTSEVFFDQKEENITKVVITDVFQIEARKNEHLGFFARWSVLQEIMNKNPHLCEFLEIQKWEPIGYFYNLYREGKLVLPKDSDGLVLIDANTSYGPFPEPELSTPDYMKRVGPARYLKWRYTEDVEIERTTITVGPDGNDVRKTIREVVERYVDTKEVIRVRNKRPNGDKYLALLKKAIGIDSFFTVFLKSFHVGSISLKDDENLAKIAARSYEDVRKMKPDECAYLVFTYPNPIVGGPCFTCLHLMLLRYKVMYRCMNDREWYRRILVPTIAKAVATEEGVECAFLDKDVEPNNNNQYEAEIAKLKEVTGYLDEMENEFVGNDCGVEPVGETSVLSAELLDSMQLIDFSALNFCSYGFNIPGRMEDLD